MSSRSNGLATCLLLACVGCVGTPSVGGVAGVAPSPNVAWTAPPEDRVRDSVARPAVPPDLEQRGLLERVCRPADRRDYYSVLPDLFIHTMAQRLVRWQRFHEAIGAARTSLPIRSPEVRERLEEYEQAYAFMSQVISEALTRWQAGREDQLTRVGVPG